MVRPVYATLLLLSVTTHVRTQFFDFFGLQPIGQQTLRPLFQFDITTKRQRNPKTTRRIETTTKKNTPFSFYSDELNRRTTKRPETTTKRTTPFSFYAEDVERDKQKTKNAPAIYDYYSTTTKPSRKTTKSNPIRRHYEPNSRDSVSVNSNVNKVVSKETTNSNSGRNSQNNNSNTRNNKSKPITDTRNVNVHKLQQSLNNNDRLIFDDDGRRNTVINYETTKPFYTTKSPFIYETNKKNVRTTSRPYTVKPGVRPAIVNGPPITNRPATQRPSFGPQGNEDVSPELIIGPSEEYMTTVEKKRYIEIAEKMCDKYKALDIKQIQAIPLVPSPDPVRVNVSTCTPFEVALVVGGRVASIQEFRHMALLGWQRIQSGGYAWKCGGSLVSNQFVLTAAHCAYQDRDNSVVIGPPRVVQLGSSYLDDPGAVVVRVAAVVRHPKYKLPKSYYDIALVKMANTVTFSSVIKPACLGIPPPPGRPIIATGWGRTEFGGDQSQELRSVSLPIWDMGECYSVLGTSRRLPEGPSSDSQVCAGEKKGGKDTCQGDSGGPAQIQDGCSWRVVAVTSVGRSCGAAQTPALYAKVPRAFVSAVVFGGQSDNQQSFNNNQDSFNNNQQTFNNNQQSNNNNQESQQWNTNQQQSNQWNGQQQNNNNQQWNNNQQSSNQQQSNNWNNNQQDSNWNWNRYQEGQNKNPTTQSNNNNQWNYNKQEQSNNNGNNQNVKRDDQNNNQNGQSNIYQSNNQNNGGQSENGYTTKKPVYNNGQYNGGQSENGYTTKKPVYNNGQYNGGQSENGYTTKKPVYNNEQYNGGQSSNGYTTKKPVYNNGQYNGGQLSNGYTTKKPVYNNGQYNGGQSSNGYTTKKPVYNNGQYNGGQSSNGYTTKKPVYNNGQYNGGQSENGYTPQKPVYNNEQYSGYNNGYTTENPFYNNGQYSGNNNGYTSEKPIYNNGQYSDYTEKPTYNQQSGYNNGYTEEKPVYNQHSGYNNGQYSGNNGYTSEKPIYNNGQYSDYTEKPTYNQQSGYNNGYTEDKPVYNQQSGYNNGYYSGDYDAVVPSGYQSDRRVYNDERIWWT